MSPTPEQIAAMDARGWAWDNRRRAFRATPPDAPIFATVRSLGGGWWATFGGSAVLGGPSVHPDPLTAADEAESWLRGVLSGFRFPWLEVKP